MEDFHIVERLVEILSAYFIEGIPVEEDLTYSLRSKFLKNIQDVLFTKQIVSFSRFQEYFNEKSKEMLSSPETYLRHVFYACVQDGLVNTNIFERFLNAFAIILRISIETRLRTGLDFCRSVPVTFMVFYDEELRVPFRTCKGFRRFVEYVNNPKYLQLKCVVRNISSFYDPNVFFDEIPQDLREKAWRMIRKEPELQTSFKFDDPDTDKNLSFLAKSVIEIISNNFIPIHKDYDLNASTSNLVQQKTAQTDEERKILVTSEKVGLKSISERCTSLKSDFKNNDDGVVQMTDNERYEKIIAEVIRHNHSKSSCHVRSKCLIQMEDDQNLEHMKSKIQSLLQVLDEYDKE